MTIRAVTTGFILLAALSLAACATTSPEAPVAERSHPDWLTGTWKGSAWQTAAGQTQGQQPVTITFARGGAWKTEAGGSGSSYVHGDRVVVEGTAGDGTPIRYTFKQREDSKDQELWGVVQARYGTAAVSVKRAP